MKEQNDNEIIFYTSPEGNKKIEVFFKNENAWLTQKAMAELFGVQRPSITKHLKNIFDTGELREDSVSSILEHTAEDRKVYATKYYSLDAIIAVGMSRCFAPNVAPSGLIVLIILNPGRCPGLLYCSPLGLCC